MKIAIIRKENLRQCIAKGLIEMEHHGLSSALISGLIASFEKINNISRNNK